MKIIYLSSKGWTSLGKFSDDLHTSINRSAQITISSAEWYSLRESLLHPLSDSLDEIHVTLNNIPSIK
jgi:hypothetical protein